MMTEIVRGQRVPAPQLAAARDLRARQTGAEHALWQRLRAGRVGGVRFRRQQPLGPYILDFYCAAARLVIEVDGPIHERQRDYDRERDTYLAARGLRVLRFTNDAIVADLDGVVRAIRDGMRDP